MKYSILFFIVICTSLSGVHATSLVLENEVESRFTKTVADLISINKEIQKNPENILIEKLFSKRDILTRYAKNLYAHLEKRKELGTLYDVSDRYKLTLQKYPLSCEVAALRTLLETRTGKYYDEETLIKKIPQFKKPLKNGIWGDPEKEFVGYYHGTQAGATGYGVYGFPLVRVLDSLGYDNEYRNTLKGKTKENEELEYALDSLEKGNHVMLWGDWCTSPDFDDGIVEKIDMYIIKYFSISGRNTCERSATEREMSWKTGSGESIKGISGEHAFILLGYVGKKANPTHIIVWDTDTGKHIYPILEWMRKWSLLDHRMLIIRDNIFYKNKK